MPLTKEKYVVKENAEFVLWERETRLFLRQLALAHGHRVSAVMVYEWATNTSVRELQEGGGSANGALRHINKVLRHHFGAPKPAWINSKKVLNAYRVPVGWMVKRHRPLSVELLLEHMNGTLEA